MLRVVQFISVFCDWGRMNPDYLHSVTSSSSLQQQSQGHTSSSQIGKGDSNLFSASFEILQASGEQLRGENRTRSSLRVTVADMKVYLTKLFPSHSNAEGGSKLGANFQPTSDPETLVLSQVISLPLPEYIELRGYLPFRDYEVHTFPLFA